MENTGDSIYVKDLQCRVWRISRKMAMSLGISDPAEAFGKTDIDLFGESFGKRTMKDDLEVIRTGKPKIGVIEKYVTKSGEVNWTSTTKFPLCNEEGEIIGLVGITREINELKSSEIEFEWMATHDPLTSLPNRYLLVDHINQAIHRCKRHKSIFGLLYIDLDGFKEINDRNGHDQGDRYLKVVADVLTQNLRSTDTVARIGGDEFVCLLDGLQCQEDAIWVSQKISNLIYDQADQACHSVTASIGVSFYPSDGVEADELLKAADHAMYATKRSKNPKNS
jgi:diguanylate cyclase (GGDEF)-like protein/PAS domain S-box-containing protein